MCLFSLCLYLWLLPRVSPVFVVANVLLVSSPPALTLAQVGSLYLGTCRDARTHARIYLLDNASGLGRCIRASDKPHNLLVICRANPTLDHLICGRWAHLGRIVIPIVSFQDINPLHYGQRSLSSVLNVYTYLVHVPMFRHSAVVFILFSLVSVYAPSSHYCQVHSSVTRLRLGDS